MDEIDVSIERPEVTTLLDDADALELERIVGRTFRDEEVYIDGRSFVNCSFRAGTTLVVRLGLTEFTRCKFPDRPETYRLTISGTAAVIKHFLDTWGIGPAALGDTGRTRLN